MRLEYNESGGTTPTSLCFECQQRSLNSNDKSQYLSSVEELKRENIRLNKILENKKPANAWANDIYEDIYPEETNEETPILSSCHSSTKTFNNSKGEVDNNAIVEELRNEVIRLNKIIDDTNSANKCMDDVYLDSPLKVAIRRLPALFLTLFIELIGGMIISKFHLVIKKYTLLVSFMPALSALSGNLGLQAGSNTIRGLGTGHIMRGEFRKNIVREIKSGLISATAVSITIGLIGTSWSYFGDEKIGDEEISKVYLHHDFLFGAVLFFGSWISMMIACFNGSATPIAADSCGLDPAKVAGPLETAFQDIFGQTFLLGASFLIFRYSEPYFWFDRDDNGVYDLNHYIT